MGQLCKMLDQMVCTSIWYDTFTVQNSKCLRFVNDVVTGVNNDKALCRVFGLYPAYVTGTLSKVQEINFYILSNNKLKYLDYIQNWISGKECIVSSKRYVENFFKLSFGDKTVDLTFEIRIMDGDFPS